MSGTTLSSFLEYKAGVELKGKLFLLSDALTDGAFLFHHFLQDLLSRDRPVVMVSLLHTLLHYSSVAAKFGVNLRKKKEEGKLVFVDGLSYLLSQHFTTSTHGEIDQSSCQEVGVALDSNLKVGGILTTLEPLLVGGACLLIDDLNVLLNVGVDLPEVIVLVQCCLQLLASQQPPCKELGCMVVAVHLEGVAGKGREEELLYRHLLHLCQLHCHAHGLKTGYSRDVHGDVTATWRDPGCSQTEPLPPTQTAQFKLTDRSVQLFARGLSTASP